MIHLVKVSWLISPFSYSNYQSILLIIWSLNSQLSTKLYTTVMYCSADSSSCWLWRLNLARSNIVFFLTLKNSSNFSKMSLYFFLCSVVMPVETKTSAFCPNQYNRVLIIICLSLSSKERSNARWNCSKQRFQQCYLYGFLKSKQSGGNNLRFAIRLLLSPCVTLYNV